MKYCIYFEFKDGYTNSLIVLNRQERDKYIMACISDNDDIKTIRYCKIYTTGEYGKRKTVLNV